MTRQEFLEGKTFVSKRYPDAVIRYDDTVMNGSIKIMRENSIRCVPVQSLGQERFTFLDGRKNEKLKFWDCILKI